MGLLVFAAGIAAGWVIKPTPPNSQPAIVLQNVSDPRLAQLCDDASKARESTSWLTEAVTYVIANMPEK